MDIVFIVDDNLIGNKKAIKPVLREVIGWQEARGYPLTFYTEASIDLADDPELMGLMADANVISVFVGSRARTRRRCARPRSSRTFAQEAPCSRRCGEFRTPVWRSGAG